MATSIAVTGVLTASYTRVLDYDAQGRLSTVDHNGAVTYTYGYGARGHRTEIRHGTTVLQAFEGTDAFGSSTAESFNGGAFKTERTFDAATGRLSTVATGPAATPKGVQDLEYKWREDGSLYRRIDRRGTSASSDDRTDTFTMDPLSRVERQATRGGTTRTLDFDYDGHGNLKTKTSTVAGDLDATAYTYGTTGKPHRLTRVTLDGVVNTLAYDANGNITAYDAATGDDTAIVYDGRNRATSITVGAAAPKDEFWHGPDGNRFLRRETWTEGETAKTKLTVYVGAYEEVRRSDATVKRVRASSGNVVRIRVEPASGTATERFEYVHRDHLGSVDRVTDGNGAAVATLSAASFDPFGGRRDAGWSADESPATGANVLALQDERFSRGFTDHEGLHRTGFVHMNGRVYDPRIGRFLQPDPVVSAPGTGQGHNRYAYVGNAPLSATDPSGFVPVGGYVGRTGGNADYGPLFGSLMNDLWSSLFRVRVVEPAWEAFHRRVRLNELRRVAELPNPKVPPEVRTRARMALYAYDAKESDKLQHTIDGYTVVDYRKLKNGLKLVLFDNGSDAVVAAAGTDEFRDWYHNFRQGLGFASGQYEEAKKIANKWAKAYTNLHFTGHSLGGRLAMAMAAKTGHYSSYTVFNSAGLHPATVGGAEEFAKLTGDHYYSRFDVLRFANALSAASVPGRQISLGRAGWHPMKLLCRMSIGCDP